MAYTSIIGRSVEIGLRSIGVWPDSSHSHLHRFFWASTMAMAQTFQYRHVVVHFGKSDLAQFMDDVTTTVSYTLLFFKLSIFWLNRRIFHDILTTMAADWADCAGKSDMLVMTSTADLSRRCSNVIIGLYSMSVVFYAAGIVANPDNRDNDTVLSETVQRRELLLKMELPFECDSSPNYEIVMIAQFFHQLAATMLVGVLNSLIVVLILHVSSQIDIACHCLSEISFKDVEKVSRLTAVKAVIVKHQRIISLSNDIERLMTYMALIQFLCNSLVLCALGYVIVISIGTNPAMLVKSFMYYVVITLESFVFCYAGEYLTAKSKLIGNAAYESPWYDLTPAQSRVMIVLILRSQKTLPITIGKFVDLSLECFTAFVKASTSYVSVLYAMS